MIAGQSRGPRQVAAEGVNGHRIGAVQPAHEIGDGVFGVHEAAIHEVAGIEEHEHVGAHERVRPLHARQRVFVAVQNRLGGAVHGDGQRRVGAFREGGKLLRDTVLVDVEIAWLEAVDVVVLAVGHLKAQHHHVHFHPEQRPLRVLRPCQHPRSRYRHESPSRNSHRVFPFGEISFLQSRFLVRRPGLGADIVAHQTQ